MLDRVSSSYSLSIKTLIYGRRRHGVMGPRHPSEQALLVAMNQTPNHTNLPFAIDEIEAVNEIFSSLGLQSNRPSTRREDVLKHLHDCKIFHFVGHGRINRPEPSKSTLLLEDWKTNPLTVEDLRDRRPAATLPFLGYLFTYSTGAAGEDRFLDEGINMVSACQSAGFRHVIGTLWHVSDEHCVDIARRLYETIWDEGMTDVAVYKGLHKATKALRDEDLGQNGKVDAQETVSSSSMDMNTETRDANMDEKIDSSSEQREMINDYWVPYVHIGI